ncbi:hypothetical protein [Singulisphaera sp. PoT]|uniref:hypothetical protein n=1 Tax=Singulisphaera sp. PoT TaxID=3411797 RepID=UPI003BF5F96B
MARKVSGDADPRKSPDPEPRKIVLTVRGRPEWKSWLDGFAKSERVSAVVLIDRALDLYAKHVGYAPPPER